MKKVGQLVTILLLLCVIYQLAVMFFLKEYHYKYTYTVNNEEYKNINDIYEGYLLPEAIIDTTELLCRDGINLIKIISFIKNKNYFQVINEDRFNSYTPENIKNKITNVQFPKSSPLWRAF